jgi:hypothetical protein
VKKAWLSILLFSIFCASEAQTWVRKNDFPGHARLNPINFTIANEAYLGYGKQNLLSGEHPDSVEIWKYNPVSDTWTAVSGIPGNEKGTEAFNLGDSAYIKSGGGRGMVNNHFYQYMPASDSWSPRALFPADTLFNAASFSLNKQGYITGGSDTNSRPQHHTYCYNPVHDTWAEKDTLPLALNQPCGAVAAGYGFIAMGIIQGNSLSKRLFRYDTSAGWSERTPFPGKGFAPRSCQFVWKDEIYFCLDSFQCWKYTPASDLWFRLPNTPFNGAGSCFVLNNIPYIIENGSKQVWQWCPPLSLLISTSQNICKGDSAQLSISGGTSFNWSPAPGLNNPTTGNPKASPADSTLYHVLVTDMYGCKGVDSVQVNVKTIPLLQVSSSEHLLCKGDTATLTATGGFSYSWKPVAGLSNPSIANPLASPALPTHYIVTASDSTGCQKKDSLFINVQPLPNKPVICFPPAVCKGKPSKLTALGNDSTLRYIWRPYSHLTDSTGFSVFATPSSTQTYTLLTTDTMGCQGRTTITVGVHPLPSITVLANPATICSGDTAMLTATGTSVYSWAPGNSLSGSGPAVQAFPTSTTLYSVTGTDSNQCQAIASVSLSVNPTPSHPHLSVNGLILSSDIVSGNQWFLNGNLLPGDTSQTYSMQVNGVYTVCAGNSYGCFSCSKPFTFSAMSIEAHHIVSYFSVSPNPASEIITLDFESTRELPFKIELYSLQGKKENVLVEGKSAAIQQNVRVDTQGISSGIYIIKLTISDEVYQKKLVVIR